MKEKSWLIANPIPNSLASCNKDLNGGYGTWDVIGKSFFSKFLAYSKKKNIKIPILCLAYITSILEAKGLKTSYSEDINYCINLVEDKNIEGCIVYGSIVCCEHENYLIKKLKSINPKIKIFVVGTFPTKFPEKFKNADHIIIGEPEKFFLDWDGNINFFKTASQKINSEIINNLDILPIANFNQMQSNNFSYRPMLKKPTGFIESSRGCPYSCGYYCTYGENQGKLIRSFSAIKMVEIMHELIKKNGFKSFQFRDPVFGLKKRFVDDFCTEIIKQNLKIEWGIETRLDLLNKGNLRIMANAGLKSINVGIETPNDFVALGNKRKTIATDQQKEIIEIASKLGIRINAFYIIALEEDDEKSCLETIKYSLSLNTYMARYSVCTPFPGTQYFEFLKSQNRILTEDLNSYNQQDLVYKHKKLSPIKVKKLVQKAYIDYYFRPKIIFKVIKQRLD